MRERERGRKEVGRGRGHAVNDTQRTASNRNISCQCPELHTDLIKGKQSNALCVRLIMWLKCLWCFAGFQALFCTEETIRSRGEREKAAQLFRKSNKSSVSSLDGDFCSCLEGYWTDLCVCVCVCVCVFQDVSTVAAQCVWSLTFLAGLCVIVPPVFWPLSLCLLHWRACAWTSNPPPLPEACRHDNHGLRIASAARHWGGLGSCRCVCVWCIYRCSFVQWCMEIILVFSSHLHWYLVCHEAEGCLEGWDGLAVVVWC